MSNVKHAVLQTERLVHRRPTAEHLQAVFDTYATDPEVTRFVMWHRHASLDDTRAFLAFSDAHWTRWGSGPLLSFLKSDGALVGGCGLIWESRTHVTTGYLFARQYWGYGFATECVRAMVDYARSEGARRLSATCHVDNLASARVLVKGGLILEGTLPQHTLFPNLSEVLQDVLSFGRTL
jgi:[ribosomal protein S5]-alanine N-acetyltransferase